MKRFHPYQIALTLTLIALSVMFIAFSIAYIYARITSGQACSPMPKIFLFNSLFLLTCSMGFVQAHRYHAKDDKNGFRLMIAFVLGLTLIFLVAQIYGWQQMGDIRGRIGANYIKALSILHFVHVVGGIPFLTVFLYRAYKDMRDPVSTLIYFSQPNRKLNLRLLTAYWHFLDGLWVFLVSLFLISGFF